MNSTPKDIRAINGQGILVVVWEDQECELQLPTLRGSCECAQCVNEWTGEQILDPSTIPPDITIEQMELVGNYALRVHWSDGHQSGLFTWEKLRGLTNDGGPDA